MLSGCQVLSLCCPIINCDHWHSQGQGNKIVHHRLRTTWTWVSSAVQAKCVFGVHRGVTYTFANWVSPSKRAPMSSPSPSYITYPNSKSHNWNLPFCPGGLLLSHLVPLSIRVPVPAQPVLTLSAGFPHLSPPTSRQAPSVQLERPFLSFYPMYNTARLWIMTRWIYRWPIAPSLCFIIFKITPVRSLFHALSMCWAPTLVWTWHRRHDILTSQHPLLFRFLW